MKQQQTTHLYFLDHLKITLIMLVVAHHAGQAYGPGGWWYFQEGESIDWLRRFFAVNAAFFMSLFFFLSAYFLPKSIERKGEWRFLKERFIRIGVPLILGFLVMIPILMYLYYINFRPYEPISFLSYYPNIFFGLSDEPTNWTGPSWPDMQFGHLWFLQHLLVYAVVLSAWTYFSKHESSRDSYYPIKGTQIFIFLLVVTLSTYIVRIWYPIDEWTGFLGFIQTEYAHVPQYISFFVLGIMAYRRNWLLTLDKRTGYIWLAIGVGIAGALYLGGNSLYPYLLKGGANFGSFTRSLIETVLCFALVIGLITLFREKLNKTNRLAKILSSHVFVVYFIHVPVVVFLQYTLSDLRVSVLAKFLLSAILGIILSFFISHFVWRKIPYLNKLM
ncbi:acyltransferase family protein [Bacillus sp. 31A1R]|uniref:Acyltransferase family protein n=1 Tax=Robertmurraya mangrovi TaxID=3098077 RepID=A0ABU5ITH5_9BACI|nr:acyltransferase family protein [Bacillus sp. 31A1R]MDZ5470431.1 acyltransferase family protein [Bacillus sp. 31A1R]